MAQLIVRKLAPETVLALKRRAAIKGRSAEAEHREILREALRPSSRAKSLKQLLLEMPGVGTDADFAAARERGRRVRL